MNYSFIKDILHNINNDIATLTFYKQLFRKPHKNLFYAFIIVYSAGKKVIVKMFSPLRRILLRKLSYNRKFYSILLLKRGNYLIPFYRNDEIWKDNLISDSWYNNLPHTYWSSKNSKNERKNNWNIFLASKSIVIKNNKFDWRKHYRDKEDTMALHRFGWLLRLLSENPSTNIIKMGYTWITDWIDFNGSMKSNISWESYSVSERIVNWLIFICATKSHLNVNNSMLKKINNALIDHVTYLSRNLEFRGDKTNNHIINNARALYISGRILRLPFAEKIGKSIIKNETDKLLPDGVLNEGSTHYQLLVTRTYLEIYWFAHKTDDYEMINWIEKKIYNMIKVCHLLSIDLEGETNKIPFIGDISPDYPPDWFYGFPFTINDPRKRNKSKWFKLFNDFNVINNIMGDTTKVSSFMNKNNTIIIKKNQWLKHKNDNIQVYSCIKNNSIKSHVHQDEGSFSVFYKNTPIIIDPGLKNYVWDDSVTQSQVKAESHNCVLVNNLGLYPSKLSFMKNILNPKPIELIHNKFGYLTKMNGFRSSGNYTRWDRSLLLDRFKLTVHDKLFIHHNSNVTINYIFNDKINLNQNKENIYLLYNNCNVLAEFTCRTYDQKILKPTSINIRKGNCSERYGETKACNILKLNYMLNSTSEITSVFDFSQLV